MVAEPSGSLKATRRGATESLGEQPVGLIGITAQRDAGGECLAVFSAVHNSSDE
jgi:hypothetical protein